MAHRIFGIVLGLIVFLASAVGVLATPQASPEATPESTEPETAAYLRDDGKVMYAVVLSQGDESTMKLAYQLLESGGLEAKIPKFKVLIQEPMPEDAIAPLQADTGVVIAGTAGGAETMAFLILDETRVWVFVVQSKEGEDIDAAGFGKWAGEIVISETFPEDAPDGFSVIEETPDTD